MKPGMTDTVEELGRKGELEWDKLYSVMLGIREQIRQEMAEDPSYELSLELKRAQDLTDKLRFFINYGRALFDELDGWVHRLDYHISRKDTEAGKDSGLEFTDINNNEEDYPMDHLYHLAVAEQEEDLQRLYPIRFGAEK